MVGRLIEKMPLDYRFTVVQADLDPFQRLSSVAYVRWSEAARADFLSRLGLAAFYPRLAALQFRFDYPVVFPDTLSLILSLQQVGRQDLALRYVFWSEQQFQMVAEAFDQVICHHADGQVCDWPEAVASRLNDLHFEQNWAEH